MYSVTIIRQTDLLCPMSLLHNEEKLLLKVAIIYWISILLDAL